MTQKIKRVAVIGTGLLGTQISMLSAYAGYKVSVYDTKDGAFDDTYKKLYADFKGKGFKPYIPWNHWEKCRNAITFTTQIGDALKDVDLVVEAITEDLEVKRNVFKQLGKMHRLRQSSPRIALLSPYQEWKKAVADRSGVSTPTFILPCKGRSWWILCRAQRPFPR